MLLGSAYGRGMPLPLRVEQDAGLVEVADRVWFIRRGPLDVVSTVVGGASGLLVVDAGDSEAAGRDLRAAVRRLGRGVPVAVVGSHAHPAHVLGNAAFGSAGVPVLLHESAAAELPGQYAEVRTLSSVTALDLGDRVVEVVHPGRGHTAGDLVVRVPDADLLVVGDLVDGRGTPSYGPDCWPLEWPGSLDLVLQLLGESGAAVAGHGAPLQRAAVEQQRDGTATVAEAVRELAGRGVPADEALAQGAADGSWPWPPERLTDAVRRGYAQLPRSARQLPLIP
jgi:glyoxylase-like metal-dependent hydrolase (beta-lactamase superfamily II)